MITRNYKKEERKENPHGVDVRQLYNKESAQVMHIMLNQGESLKPHKTPVDVAFYILEGKPTINIGNESEQYEKDHLIESPSEIIHYISNENQETARILVIKAPRPEKVTRLL
jgi:quercetin dioxygenase-like cupin family protein